MTHWRLVFCILLGAMLQANSQASGQQEERALQLFLSEVKPGSMSSEQYCMLVFANRSFHAETASLHLGRDLERKVLEGNLSDADWSALENILESDGFRKLNVPPPYVPLAIQGGHFFTISVRREKGFQNMEFLDDKSRKPYDSQLKPLFQWWKSLRSKGMPTSNAPANSQCELNNSHGVVSY
jgi:hypothetical protein